MVPVKPALEVEGLEVELQIAAPRAGGDGHGHAARLQAVEGLGQAGGEAEALLVLAAEAAVDDLLFLRHGGDARLVQRDVAEVADDHAGVRAAGVAQELLLRERAADVARKELVPCPALLVRIQKHRSVEVKDERLHRSIPP